METISIKGTLLLILKSQEDWIMKCPDCLPEREYSAEQFLFVDSDGNYMAMGADFQAAERMGTYPIKVYRLQRAALAEERRAGA